MGKGGSRHGCGDHGHQPARFPSALQVASCLASAAAVSHLPVHTDARHLQATLPRTLLADINASRLWGESSTDSLSHLAASVSRSRGQVNSNTPPAKTSRVQCIEGPPRTHACHFEDLVYDTHTRTFLFSGLHSEEHPYAPPGSTASWHDALEGDVRQYYKAEVQGSGDGAERLDSTASSLGSSVPAGVARTAAEEQALAHEHWDFLQSSSPNSTFAIGGLMPPPEDETCVVSTPTHFRSPYRSYSFGHLLRDNLQALVEIAENFGEDPASFQWAMWPEVTHDEMPHMVNKYMDWVGEHKALFWEELLETCTSQRAGSKSPRYLKFSKAIASGKGSDWTGGATRQPLCRTEHFKPLRDTAYRRYAIPHVPVKSQSEMLITILSHPEGGRREILNRDALVATLRMSLPTARVEVHDMRGETPEAQMRVLARTSVLIATIGSSSFRQIYLPDGAQAILVGALESPFVGTDGTMYAAPDPFLEVDRCWEGVDYWSVLRYHVHDVDNIERREAGKEGDDLVAGGGDAAPQLHVARGGMGDNGRRRTQSEIDRVWQADVRVDPARMLQLLRLATKGLSSPAALEHEVVTTSAAESAAAARVDRVRQRRQALHGRLRYLA